MPKFRYCGQAACFSSLAEVHRRSPEHSGLTGSRAACLQFMRCGLLLHNRVQNERDRQPHPRQTHLLSVSGAVEGSLQDSLPRTSECQAESSLGITFIALRREGAEVSQGFQEGSRGADQSCPSTEAAGEALLLEG